MKRINNNEEAFEDETIKLESKYLHLICQMKSTNSITIDIIK